MADKRISELNALTAPLKDDAILISDTSASETKKITFQNLFKLPSANTANTAAISSPAAGQVVYVSDGAGIPHIAVNVVPNVGSMLYNYGLSSGFDVEECVHRNMLMNSVRSRGETKPRWYF